LRNSVRRNGRKAISGHARRQECENLNFLLAQINASFDKRDFRLGSKADEPRSTRDFRLPPNSGRFDAPEFPF
jgi:hypothetical protein